MTSIDTPTDTISPLEPPRPWRRIGAAVVAFFLVWIAYQLVTNEGFRWSVVAEYMFSRTVMHGILITLGLTALVMIMGTIIGIIIAVMRLSGDPLLSFVAHGYVWFFRGVPVLIQLIFWYNLASLYPEIAIGLPFDGPKYIEIPAVIAISSFTAAMLGLGLNEGAYMAEIIRGGLLSVDPGQKEASKALGQTPTQTFFRVVLPQAMKSIIPPTGNQLIGTLKMTSLASTVALYELMHSVEVIYARNFETVPLLTVAALWYLFMVSVLSVIQHYIERHYAKGFHQETGGVQ
jgi:polar amino acid transport system permease protein